MDVNPKHMIKTRRNIYPKLLFCIFLFQHLNYSGQVAFGQFTPRYTQTITCEKLLQVKNLGDLIEGYPLDYYRTIIDYISVDITARVNGNENHSEGNSDILTKKQLDLINQSNLGCIIDVKIKFQYKDSSNDLLGGGTKIKNMHLQTSLLPDKEAEFPGGKEAITNYFIVNYLKQICDSSTCKIIPYCSVNFTINESGEIENIHLIRSSNNNLLDNKIINVIQNMPSWKPAENNNGQKVKEQFTISLPFRKGGC